MMKFIVFRVLLGALLLNSFIVVNDVNAGRLLNGISRYYHFEKLQFWGGLYVAERSPYAEDILAANTAKKLHMRIAAERFSSLNFRQKWAETLSVSGSKNDVDALASDIAYFCSLLKQRYQRGDHIDIFVRDEVKVFFNGTAVGKVSNPAFGELVLRAWLGDIPMSTEFKEGLLVAGEVSVADLSAYRALQPSDDRVAYTALSAFRGKKHQAHVAPETLMVKKSLNRIQRVRAFIARQPKANQDPHIPLDKDLPSVSSEEQLYVKHLRQWARRYAYYPSYLYERRIEGSVLLTIQLERNGHLSQIMITRSDGADPLVLETVSKRIARAAAPYPPVPEYVEGEQYQFQVEVQFSADQA